MISGQRKLLLSEIEFLTLFARPGDVVVYAGAAPGYHIPYLLDLFPFIKMVLVDPRQFGCQCTDRLAIRQVYFFSNVQ
jgi:hypothetical protein